MTLGPVNISHYNLNEDVLSNNNNVGSKKLGVFSSLMYAAGARHGMSPHNRKFHWNSLGEYFEPVYYDGDIVIDEAISQMEMFNDKNYDFTIIDLENVKKAHIKIQNLDKDSLYKKFLGSGGSLSKNEVELFFKKLSDNIMILKKYISNKNFAPEDIKNTLVENYFDALRKTKTENKNLKIVYNNLNEGYLLCNIEDIKCEKINLQKEETLKLISDELEKDDTIYQYIGIKENLNKKNQNRILNNYEYIVDGSDNFETKLLINDFCKKNKKFLVVGAISKFDGQIFTFDFKKKNTPCIRSFYQENTLSDDILNCEFSGILGTIAGTIGTLQSNEILKSILGIGRSLNGHILIVDLLNLNFRKVKYNKLKKFSK